MTSFQLRILPTSDLLEARGPMVTVVFVEAKAGVLCGLQVFRLGVNNTAVAARVVALAGMVVIVGAVLILGYIERGLFEILGKDQNSALRPVTRC